MSRDYSEDSMLKSKGIVYFPPVKDFNEAFSIFKECGGVIISLEEDGFLIEEISKICKLYDIPIKDIEYYFISVLKENNLSESEIQEIITTWKIDENIEKLSI
jgi:hypothetical protein